MAHRQQAGVAKEKATQATDQAREKAGQAADQAKDKAGQAAEVAQQKAGEAAGQAKGRLREQVDQRSTQLGEQVTSNVEDVRAVGEQLRQQGKERPAQIADQVAQRGERAGRYLQESDADRILRDFEDFGRQRPWAIAAAGLALGFVASRLLKASSQRRYQSSLAERGDYAVGRGYAEGGSYGASAAGTVSPAVPEAPPPEAGERAVYDQPGF
jgi:uncharacterized protein YjbJ (UPF0337 family)